MSMDLRGILNRNEYYTNHYFLSIFEENAAETIKRWQNEATKLGEKTPWAKLNAVASKYFILHDRASRLHGELGLEPIISELACEVLAALGYPIRSRSTKRIEVEPGVTIPVVLEMTKPNGAPWMWVILCRNADDNIMESYRFITSWQGYDDEETGYSPEKAAEELTHMSNEELLSKILFGMDEPPRWVMFIGLKQIALIDRNKWNEKRFLVFQLDDIFGRKETTTLQAMSVLLHKESICPSEGISLLDTLDENSHKHASGVSKDLKYALRECIELLGNEVVRDMKERQHVGVFGKDLADTLTIQCLRYMYRILFMLFIEAKTELGYAPMKAETYALGYSFESLREIADNARTNSDIERNGYYLKNSLDLLFKLIYEGYPSGDRSLLEDDASVQGVFRIDPLKAHIFDPVRTELIEKTRIRNGVLLDIINKMSYAKGQRGKRGGRISYSNLGINQLGSVYEALLSYRGFFAEEDLYEVKRSGDTVDDLDVGYFVPERELDQYDEDERVRTGPNPTDPLRMHPKGEFIYRLAGREREKSASYYTPEVLTHCLVKYALKELLEGKTADEILHLTICEPAMGSAAFLNEAVSQLAEAYLTRKEKETGATVPHDQRQQEIQKVKMYIADRNVYGIDLNPVAVELAEVSLWLNTIYQGAYVPWFRTQIVNGNSLIGARRQCYTLAQLQAGKGSAVWYENAPERILPGQKRKFAKQVYHFLAGDPGMCSYTDKVIKAMEPEKIAFIKEWNKKFIRAFNEEECDRVLELSAQIDKLWDAHVELRREIAEKTTDPLSVWGQPEDKVHTPMTIREKDAIYESLYLSRGAENASPYARLKAVMDYWCALWFWPIDKAEELPTRQEFLFDVQMMLGLDVVRVIGDKKNKGQMSVFDLMPDEDPYVQGMIERYDRFGAVNLDRLRADFPRLRIADEVARQQHFFHWELEFADVFVEKGGFDLIVGNPPWIKMEWNEQAVMGDRQPLLVVKNYTANQVAKAREHEFIHQEVRSVYLAEYTDMSGTQAFLRATQNYPTLSGAVNLYKCFIPQAFQFCNASGISAFVHPNSVFDDPKEASLRKLIYPRLVYHFSFVNEKNLFEINHTRQYSLNVYTSKNTEAFDSISNLYVPETIDQCYETPETEELPLMKTSSGEWEIKGHPDRIIKVNKSVMSVFAAIFDASDEWYSARLPLLHCKQLIDVLRIFMQQKVKLADVREQLGITGMWDEATSQADGTIIRQIHFPEGRYDMIYSSPHIGLANPVFKSSKRVCRLNSDYETIDISTLPELFFPRCNFRPACDLDTYRKRAPKMEDGKLMLFDYRLVWRSMLNQSGERTLLPCIIPPHTGHIDLIFELRVPTEYLALLAGAYASLPIDFYVKAIGKAHARFDVAANLPLLLGTEYEQRIRLRALLLNCLTSEYAELWEREFSEDFQADRWAKNDPRLGRRTFSQLSAKWEWATPVRSDYSRREALVELDVLTAMALGMTLNQLKTIYKIQFPVLRKNEADTWYDANGRIVFTISTNIPGVGVDRKRFESEMQYAPAGTKFYQAVIDDTQPGGPVERTIEYVAPFDRCDREQDYETAWAFFSKQL